MSTRIENTPKKKSEQKKKTDYQNDETIESDAFNPAFFISLFQSLSPDYFIDQNGVARVTYQVDDIPSTFKINSPAMKSSISRLARMWRLKKITSNKIDETIAEMNALAIDSGKIFTCSIRSHRNTNGDVTIQLAKDSFCRISSQGNGFRVSCTTDLKFDWLQKQQNLPIPERISSSELISILLKINNLEKEDEIYLLIAYILKSLVVDSGANPIAILQGPQGSSKSTSSNNIKKLIDPTLPLLVSPPRCEAEVLTTANSSYFIAYDNLSGLSSDLADTFCRLSTGGGISKRALYSDDDEKSYNLLKSLLFNGIDEASNRPDFNDRAIIFHLKKIPFEKRVSEIVLKENFDNIYPKILGGLYALLSEVLKILPNIRTEGLPRMTEYARFGIALEKVLELEEGFFIKCYDENIKEKIDTNFWNDDVCNAIFTYFYSFDKVPHPQFGRKPPAPEQNIFLGEYSIEGTADELRQNLSTMKSSKNTFSHFPKTAKGFSEQLKRIEPLLNEKGIMIERSRQSFRRLIRITAKIEDSTLKELRDPRVWSEVDHNFKSALLDPENDLLA